MYIKETEFSHSGGESHSRGLATGAEGDSQVARVDPEVITPGLNVISDGVGLRGNGRVIEGLVGRGIEEGESGLAFGLAIDTEECALTGRALPRQPEPATGQEFGGQAGRIVPRPALD